MRKLLTSARYAMFKTGRVSIMVRRLADGLELRFLDVDAKMLRTEIARSVDPDEACDHIMRAWTKADGTTRLDPRRVVHLLNEQHERHGAGFYPTAVCSRAFGARLTVKGQVEILIAPDTWELVNIEAVGFNDHNGRSLDMRRRIGGEE